MELLNQEEILYKISDTESKSREQIVSRRLSKTILNINPQWLNRKFEDFNNTILKDTANKLNNWDFENPNIASILSTQNGIGKTHLATCIYLKYIYKSLDESFESLIKSSDYLDTVDGYYEIINWVNSSYNYRNYKKAEFLSEKKLSLIIQESFNNKNFSQLEILENYCKLDFLVIDDCFAMKQNDFARQNIFYIIDERAEWNNKPTFITSNLSLKEIADIDTRIADRIRNSMMFQITDKIESYRKNK